MNTKQVIVMRKDLNMSKGKMCAQASHACMAFMTRHMMFCDAIPPEGTDPMYEGIVYLHDKEFFTEVRDWMQNSFRKICLYVNSLEELEFIHALALEKGLMSEMIIDNGATEFNGIPTTTCCAIGPHIESKFEGITDHLPLL